MRCKKFTTLLLTSLFVIGALFVPTARVHALFSCIPIPATVPDLPVSVPVSNVGAAIRQNISNTYQSSQTLKECIWDATVTFLKEALIQNITGSIVDWINNDFEGGPAFVTDPAGFFVNIADETAGNFIENHLGGIGQILCSPFDLHLRLNLWLSTSASRKQYLGCRLTDIQQNAYEAFTSGGFIANGGWSTFNALTSDPRNNQYGAFIYASDALNTEFIKKANEKLRELSYGKGFLSYKTCIASKPETNSTGGHDCAKYEVQTPGSLINDQLNNAFGSELRKIELADEINEVFEALANFGLRKVFTKEGGGLLGASRRGAERNATVTTNFNKFFSDAQNDPNTTRNLNSKVSELNTSDPTHIAVGGATKNTGGGSGGQTAPDRNLALNQHAEQSSTFYGDRYYSAGYAVDGIRDGGEVGDNRIYSAAAITNATQPNYWGVTLTTTSALKKVRIYTRTDHTLAMALGTITITVYNEHGGKSFEKSFSPNASPYFINLLKENGNQAVIGNRVQITRTDAGRLELAEVEVYGTEGETTPAGSGTTPASGVSVGTPTVSVVSVTANTGGALEAIFTANENITGVKVRVTLQKKESEIFKNFAPGQVFEAFFVRVKNPDTTVVKFTQALITQGEAPAVAMTNAAPYTLNANTVSAVKSERVSVGYEFTPTSAAKGQTYQLITELLDNAKKPIPGAIQTLQFSVP